MQRAAMKAHMLREIQREEDERILKVLESMGPFPKWWMMRVTNERRELEGEV